MAMSRRAWYFATVGALALPAAPLGAQLSDWASIAVSPSAVIREEATVLAVQDGANVHVFSALTRSWSTLATTSGSASFWRFNDHVIVQDGATFYGFKSRRRVWEPLATTSGSATFVITVPFSFVSVVLDGNRAHLFTPFVGGWTTVTFAATPSASVNGYTAVIGDGSAIVGVSGFFGVPVAAPAAAGATIAAYGYCGVAQEANTVHAFSAHRNAWASVAASPSAIVSASGTRPGFLVIEDGLTTTFFSGLSGTFASVARTGPGALATQDQTAVLVDGQTAYAYSGPKGTIATLALAAAPTVTVGNYVAVVQVGSETHAFSSPHAAFAPPLAGSFAVGVTESMAVATPLGSTAPAFVYSAVRNAWTPAPAIPNPGVVAFGSGVVLVDPSAGLYGLSARGDAWVFQSAPPPDAIFSHLFLACARSGNRLDAFNTRTERWHTRTTSAPANVTVYKATLLALDGAEAHAFCVTNDRWSATAFPGAPASSGVENTLAFVFDGGAVHAYGGIGGLSNLSEYPELPRFLTLGGPFAFHLAGEPGAAALLLYGPSQTNLPVPPFGTLFLDPATMGLLAVPSIPSGGVTTILSGVLPPDPALVGVPSYFQAVLFPPGATPYLTNLDVATAY